jgi:prophage antirepressor-like protein
MYSMQARLIFLATAVCKWFDLKNSGRSVFRLSHDIAASALQIFRALRRSHDFFVFFCCNKKGRNAAFLAA